MHLKHSRIVDECLQVLKFISSVWYYYSIASLTRFHLGGYSCIVGFDIFAGKWTQILGVFASKSNVKASVLSKILLEATILAKNAGLFVDYWTSDGATWNRALWKLFGIKGVISLLLIFKLII